MSLTATQQSSRLFKSLMGVSETTTTRDFFEEPIRTAAAVLPTQVWMYGDRIPNGSDPTSLAIIQGLTNGGIYTAQIDDSTSIDVVKRWVAQPMTMVDAGTNTAFKLMDGGTPINNIIPFNFGDGVSYNYALTKNDGTTIAFGVGDWVLDTTSGVLTFYGSLPSGVSAALPPKISFYQYIGGLGIPQTVSGFEGAIVNVSGYQGSVNTSSWSSSNSNLGTLITAALNSAWPNFETVFGYAGTDTTEGVAVSFQKVLPLVYAKTQSVVKAGVGNASSVQADSEVYSLLARTHVSANLNNISGLTVDFVSQTTPAGSTTVFKYTPDGSLSMSVDGGATYGNAVTGINTLVAPATIKVAVGTAYAFVRRTLGALPSSNQNDTITVDNTQTTLGLVYWNNKVNDYLPYVNLDATSQFEFGIPIVLKLGKIPASIKLSTAAVMGGINEVAPQYYGVRPTSVVVAVQSTDTTANSPSPDGSDYIVSNAAGAYLENIIASILANQPTNFVGEIVLRAGTYQMYSDFTLANQPSLKIRGESKGSVTIQALNGHRTLNITASSSPSKVYIEDVTIIGNLDIVATTSDTGIARIDLLSVSAPNTTVTINNGCNVTLLNVSSLSALTILGTAATLGDRLISNSNIGTVTHSGTNTIYRNAQVGTFAGDGNGTGSWIDGSYIGTLTSLDDSTQFTANVVANYGAGIADRFNMTAGRFEVIDSGKRYWTSFSSSDPILYDAIAHRFKMQIDPTTLVVNNGVLTVNAFANVIQFTDSGVTRPDGVAVTATDVQGAIADLYGTKADLQGGKIPLAQLPDSLANGGLAYKGLWSFETSGGAYPTLAQLEAQAGAVGTPSPTTAVIPAGWFVIVAASSVANAPATAQVASDGTSYTFGDWAVFNGTGWEKIDNAATDASSAILPATPASGGTWTAQGLLPLGQQTIAEGFDLVNEILAKLAPPQPAALNTVAFTYKSPTPAPFSAKDLTDVTRTGIFDNTTPNFGTPSSPNDITGLFNNGDSGTLTATIDGITVGTRTLTTADDTGTYGALKILADMDPWLGTAGKANFWKGLRATIAPVSALSFGAHTYQLAYGTTTNTATVYVDNPAGGLVAGSSAVMSIDSVTITASPPVTAHYLSGAPSIAGATSFTISPFNAINTVSQFYNATQVATVATSTPGVSIIPKPATSHDNPAPGSWGQAVVSQTVVNMPASAYDENVTFTITPYSAQGTAGSATVIATGIRIDTLTETDRVFSGTAASLYPTIGATGTNCGAPFDSTQSLVAGDYVGELQKIGTPNLVGNYRWPAGNYSIYSAGAPDYTSAAGVTVAGQSGTWRWATFKFSSFLSNASSFKVTLNNPSAGFNVDGNNQTANILLFAQVVGSSGTGWLNANAAYPGTGTPVNNGDAAMVAGNAFTTANQKYVTFGPVARTGDLYIRVGIMAGSGLVFSGVSVAL
jgi:hypothetical protein